MEQATFEENKLELITINDFNVICRFCLDRIGKLTPIFKHESSKNNNAENNENIPSQIKSCLGIEINIDDGLPIFICCDCQNQLNQWNNFRQRCISSIETLQQILSRQKESQYYNNFFDPVTDEQPIDNDNDLINEPIDQNTDEDNKLKIASNLKAEKQGKEEKFNYDDKPVKNENTVKKAKSKSENTQQKGKRSRPKKDNVDRVKRRQVMCYICGRMQSNIKLHLLIHDSANTVECAYCGKKFAQKNNLHTHFKIHINDRPHQCPICPYKFQQAAYLRRHMYTHTGEKPFKCDMCPRQFAQKCTLKDHRTSHTQNRQIPCPHCDKMFLTKRTLRSHVGTHTGERSFKCEVCSLGFVSSSGLSAHRRVHKRENPTIQCELCPQVFESRTMWRSHIRDHGLNTLPTRLKVFGI